MSDLSGAIAAPLSTTPRPFPAILLGGLIVGALDLIYAILVYSPQSPFASRKPSLAGFSA